MCADGTRPGGWLPNRDLQQGPRHSTGAVAWPALRPPLPPPRPQVRPLCGRVQPGPHGRRTGGGGSERLDGGAGPGGGLSPLRHRLRAAGALAMCRSTCPCACHSVLAGGGVRGGRRCGGGRRPCRCRGVRAQAAATGRSCACSRGRGAQGGGEAGRALGASAEGGAQRRDLPPPQEEEAHAAARGIWAGAFEEPAAWRRAQRAASSAVGGGGGGDVPAAAAAAATLPAAGALAPAPSPTPAPGQCLVKGNINAQGQKLYHAPGSRSYNATVIDVSKGERWFCSEAEAEAAGWWRAS